MRIGNEGDRFHEFRISTVGVEVSIKADTRIGHEGDRSCEFSLTVAATRQNGREEREMGELDHPEGMIVEERERV